MTIKGIDCAVPLTLDKAKTMAAAGMKFACRYLVPASMAWKRLTRTEAELITSAGMKVVSVFQRGTSDVKGGATNGSRDGKAACQEAAMVGQPPGTAIYFAVDYDAQPADYNSIESYLRAAAKELPDYLVGVYGSYAVIEEMAKRCACQRFWQTYAWSKGKLSKSANIYQYKNGQTLAGHTVDFNDGLGNEGWWDTNPQPVNKPVDKPANKQADTQADTQTKVALQVLKSAGVIQTPEYWFQNAYEGGIVRGDYAALLIQNMAKALNTATPQPEPTKPEQPKPEPETEPKPPAQLDWTEVEKCTALASVAITYGAAGFGSGTLFPGGFILTAKHVGNGATKVNVRTKSHGTFSAHLVALHPGHTRADGKYVDVDVALYRVSDEKVQNSLPSMPIAERGIEAGQELLAVVHGDKYGTVKRGAVDRPTINTSSPPTPYEFDCSVGAVSGDSGGGVVNQHGQVVGVIIQRTSVNAKIGSVWQRVPGCEAVNVTHPVVADWLKQFL